MEIVKRYGNAVLALIGLAALFLPVSISGSAVQILQRWKVQSMPLALILCAVLTAVTIMVIISCYMEYRRAIEISKVTAAVSLIVMFGLVWLDNGGFSMPEAGGLFFALAMLLIIVNSMIGKRKEESFENSAAAYEAEGSRKEMQEQARREEAVKPSLVQELRPGSLQIFCGLFAGAEIEMKHMQTIIIGRDASQCNLIIEDDAVSQKHCTVTYNAVNDMYLLMDISGNGTYLADGQRIPRNFAVELQTGTEFYVGEEKNRFQLGNQYAKQQTEVKTQAETGKKVSENRQAEEKKREGKSQKERINARKKSWLPEKRTMEAAVIFEIIWLGICTLVWPNVYIRWRFLHIIKVLGISFYLHSLLMGLIWAVCMTAIIEICEGKPREDGSYKQRVRKKQYRRLLCVIMLVIIYILPSILGYAAV